MRSTSLRAAVILALLGAHPVIASQNYSLVQSQGQSVVPGQAERLRALAEALEKAKREQDPYRQLFKAPELKPTQPSTRGDAAPPLTAPTVVCGMTIIPADPSIDPKMIITRPPSTLQHTLRVIPPPVCTR